jgi:hypothetical protein
MAVYVSNLVVDSGIDFNQVFTLESQNENSALNLSNYAVLSQLRKHSGSSSYTNFTTQVVNSSLGKIRIGLASSITSALKPGRYVYDVVIQENGTGVKSKVVEGMVLVREGVTR